ncbi:MAG TPA: tetratricopeptide repeat protein [Chloroflexota bacterium]
MDERSDARAQLLHYLAAKDCLLVLDNFEQLLGEVDFLVDILTRTPGVCILVTSRLPLGLQAEQRVQLRGLDYPGQIDETSPARHPPETAGTGIASASSVQLFIQAARRVDPSFSLSVANERDVLRICRLVDGMPLALQLAAPWVRVMDCAAIAAAIERSLELLATNARDVPDRQRSIEGVFAESWRLLAPGERAALAQLSVFHGPFDLEAAVSIAGASALELASLLDKGLLHRGGDGRYQLHELLRQFGTAAAASVPDVNLDSVRDRHSSYYLGLVATGESALYGPNARIATSALEDQRGNLRQAWLWAAEHGRQQALESSLEGIVRFWELTSRFEAAETMLAEAASFVQRSHDANVPPDSKVSALLTRLLVWEAHFGETRDRIDDAIEVAEAALRVAQSAIDLEGEALARMVLGEILPHRGEFVRAIAQLEAACAYFADHGHPRRLARALGRLGTAHWRACEYSSAAEQLERARVLQESLGDQWELARVSSSLAGVAFEQGDLERAQVRAEAALALYQASGDRRSIAAIRGNLALIYQLLGRFELALQHNQCDVETSRQLGDRHSAATALGNRASIFLEGGARKEALDCFQEALQIEEELGNTWDAARHRAGVARLLHLQGEREMALAHFEQALPILRARDAPYYTVDPLLNAAELQLDRARVEEAAELTREATAAARKLDLREQLMQGQVLEAKIARARGEPDLGWTLLQQLLSKAEDEIERALLHYELWHTWHDEAHADAALRLYRDLYERSPRHVYRVRVAELAASLSTSQEVSPL